MSQSTIQYVQAESRNLCLRDDLLSVSEDIVRRAGELEMAEPPTVLHKLMARVADPTCTVLVVGEAKRGKSTLINALIGHDLLPTDVDVATCQIFRVRHAEQPAFRLRFEDGASRDIDADQLGQYGSQVQQGEDAAKLDQVLRWIEIDAPARFLPTDIVLLDTPGLGTLYAWHSEMTNRWIPEADAVIYVLSSSTPVGDDDFKALDSIVDATPFVFFVQTKIDEVDRQAWQAMLQRNEQLLEQRYGNRLADRRVWPISSVNLASAAAADDDDLLFVSRFGDMEAALSSFLGKVRAVGRAAPASSVLNHYHTQARSALATRLATTASATDEDRGRQAEALRKRQQQFASEWSPRGTSRRRLIDSLNRTRELCQQQFRQSLQSGGRIESDLRSEIEQLVSIRQANLCADGLLAQVNERVTKAWQEAGDHFEQGVHRLLTEFELNSDQLTISASASELTLVATETPAFDSEWYSKLRGANMNIITMGTAAGIATSIVATLFPPAALYVGIGGLWHTWRAVKSGWDSAGESQLASAKNRLQSHLGTLLQQARRHFFDVDAANQRGSRYEEYFAQQHLAVIDYVDTTARQRAEAALAEAGRLETYAKQDKQQRGEASRKLRQQITDWDKLGQRLDGVRRSIQQRLAG